METGTAATPDAQATPARILVTSPPMIQAIEAFEQQFEGLGWEVDAADIEQTLPEDELAERLPDYDGWIAGDDPITREVLAAGLGGRLCGVVKWGVGTDNVDFEAAEDLGVPVTNTPGVFEDEVADVALAYLIGLAHRVVAIDRGVRQGDWPKPQGVSLQGRRAGVVGLGSIGSALARRLDAIGMEVVGYDPYTDAPDFVEAREWPGGLDDLDALLLTCPLTEETEGMVNADAIDTLPDHALLVNVARGGLLDQKALVEELNQGGLGGAALDVFREEPLPAEDPLVDCGDVILGSHNASNTEQAVRRATQGAIEKLAKHLESGSA